MKKLLLTIVALAVMSSTASALSFNWTSSVLKFDDVNVKNSSSVSAYLIYLGNENLSSSYTLAELPSVLGPVVSTATGTSAMSKVNSTKYTFDYGTKDNGDKFAMAITYNDGKDTYWNLSSTVYTLSGIADETSSLNTATFTFANTKAADSMSVAVGGGWTKAASVPEPATGALALAGLALLFRRRRA